MKKFLLMNVGVGFALALCLIGDGFSQTSVEKVLASPDVPIQFENPGGAPLLIQEANTKVITRTEYQQLVGGAIDMGPRSVSHYTTYPTATIVNTTDQRVIKFSLMLKKPEDKTKMVVLAGVNIAAGQTYTLDRMEWRPAKTPPDLRSPAMWSPGDASDLVIKVGAVTLEDGSKWFLPY